MTPPPHPPELPTTSDAPDVAGIFGRREEPARELASQATAVAAACHAMALRFHQGGKLLVFGTGTSATDAQHVAVEFVHPVIVGKRALPALSLTADVATVSGIAVTAGVDGIFAHQLRCLAAPADIAMGISTDGQCAATIEGLRTAGDLGLLTIALVGAGGGVLAAQAASDHLLVTAATDPRIVKEMQVTSYHVLWELVHVFFEQPGLLAPTVIA
ncbi:MAG TPA: SIS domain-containing protein [Streptosporangiaceae bacterium]